MSLLIDLTGVSFNKWTVLHRLPNKNKRTFWLCKCDCGVLSRCRTGRLKNGDTKGCRECTRTTKFYHKKLFETWRSMIRRCYEIKNKNYKNYGNRGIVVCDRWLESFDNFISDMGKKLTENHSIEIINNDGNYEKSNCVWATQKEQCRNYRGNRLVNYKGNKITIVELSETTGVKSYLLYQRLNRGYTVEQAINKIVNKGLRISSNKIEDL